MRKRKSKFETKVLRGDDFADAIINDLEDEGVSFGDNENVEEDFLSLPAFITEVPSRELGEYFNAHTQQRNYVNTLRAQCTIRIKDFQRELSVLRGEFYARNDGTQKKIEAMFLSSNSNVIDLVNSINTYESKLDMINAYIDNMDKSLTLISREISRREDDLRERFDNLK